MNDITNFERLNIIINKINNKNEYIRFLKFCKKFYEEDYKNQLLIYLQCPDAIKVGSFIDWKTEGRNLKKNPRKIYLYGYYREKKSDILENQIDIKGKTNKKRKITIECFNNIPYRKICKYDFADTYIDRRRRVALKNINNEREDCSDLTKNKQISLIINQINNYKVYESYNFENNLIMKFISDSVGFLVSNYFEFDLKAYCFFELDEYLKLDIYEKIKIGSVIQKETQNNINLILKSLDNKNQICA